MAGVAGLGIDERGGRAAVLFAMTGSARVSGIRAVTRGRAVAVVAFSALVGRLVGVVGVVVTARGSTVRLFPSRVLGIELWGAPHEHQHEQACDDPGAHG